MKKIVCLLCFLPLAESKLVAKQQSHICTYVLNNIVDCNYELRLVDSSFTVSRMVSTNSSHIIVYDVLFKGKLMVDNEKMYHFLDSSQKIIASYRFDSSASILIPVESFPKVIGVFRLIACEYIK